MGLIELIVVLVVVGVLLWAVGQLGQWIDPVVMNVIRVVVLLFVILWVLQAFGILGTLNAVRIH